MTGMWVEGRRVLCESYHRGPTRNDCLARREPRSDFGTDAVGDAQSDGTFLVLPVIHLDKDKIIAHLLDEGGLRHSDDLLAALSDNISGDKTAADEVACIADTENNRHQRAVGISGFAIRDKRATKFLEGINTVVARYLHIDAFDVLQAGVISRLHFGT